MSEVVNLPDQARLEDNHEFISDLCRFAEGLLTEKQVRKRHKLAESTWDALGADDVLVDKIEAEKLRRIRDGSSKREKSQVLITKAPDILDSIASDSNASPRHRVDAIKTLDGFAVGGSEAAAAGTRFEITINLGSDSLHFSKSIEPNPHDIDPYNDVDTDTTSTPWGMFAAITAKKEDGGSGQPV